MKSPREFVTYAAVAALMVVAACAYGAPNGEPPAEPACDTSYSALAETLPATGDPAGGVKLFQEKALDTACFDELRLFVHVMNDDYEASPFTSGARLVIYAYHGIGQGSWSYFSEEFPMRFTSELHGFSRIPVVGEKTRLVVFGYNLPAVELEVDVAAYLVK